MAGIDLSKIAIGGLTALLLVSLGFNVAPTDNYFCRDLGLSMECDRLSSTGNTCYPEPVIRTGSKYCSSGWEAIAPEPMPEPDAGYPAGTKVYICDQLECPQIQ